MSIQRANISLPRPSPRRRATRRRTRPLRHPTAETTHTGEAGAAPLQSAAPQRRWATAYAGG
eukprot:715978-Lingulodinium_polyedra.AAC.1